MGVEYAILDASHSRRFMLGKYFHIDILETEPRRMTRAEVRAAVEQAFSRTGEAAWKEHLAMRIWAFCESADWQVTIDLDGEEAAGAAVVLSRYDETLEPDPLVEAYKKACDAWLLPEA